MDRRTFITTSIATTALAINAIAATSTEVSVQRDLDETAQLIQQACNGAIDVSDAGDIIVERLEGMMKKWGTYKPLGRVSCVSANGTRREIDLWYNQNFFDEYFYGGLGGEGYTTSFCHPLDSTKKITATWDHDRREFCWIAEPM